MIEVFNYLCVLRELYQSLPIHFDSPVHLHPIFLFVSTRFLSLALLCRHGFFLLHVLSIKPRFEDERGERYIELGLRPGEGGGVRGFDYGYHRDVCRNDLKSQLSVVT